MESVPTSATEKRQPNPEPTPSSHSPAPMSHLPTGGCTTMSPSTREKTSGLPPVNAASGSLID
jgi:hypothetical protein